MNQEMSNEELIDDLLSGHDDLRGIDSHKAKRWRAATSCGIEELLDNYLSPVKYDNAKAELLSRLELGKQAIEIVDELYTWNLESFPHLKDMVMEFMKKREGIK